MRILFLDDMEKRHEGFKNITKGHHVDHVRTAQEAIRALEKNPPYDLVSLDHDLGGQVFTLSDEHSGYHVAQHITRMEGKPSRIVVHSWNPAGTKRMLDCFKDAGLHAESMEFGSWMP